MVIIKANNYQYIVRTKIENVISEWLKKRNLRWINKRTRSYTRVSYKENSTS